MALAALAADGWKVLAAQDAVISQVCIENGADYGGLLPLCMFIPMQARFEACFLVSDAPDMEDTSSVEIQVEGAPQPGWTYEGWQKSGKVVTLTFAIDDKECLKQIDKAHISVYFVMYQFVIPNSALDGDTVYILNSRESAFGGMEDYATAIRLDKIVADDKNTVANRRVERHGYDNSGLEPRHRRRRRGKGRKTDGRERR